MVKNSNPTARERKREERQQTHEQKIREHIERVVSEAPPMTAAQCAEVSRILYPNGEFVLVPQSVIDEANT